MLGVRRLCGEFPTWSSHRFTRSPDRIERVGLRPVAARGLFGRSTDDDLRGLQQLTTQTGAVATGPLDRPGPQHRMAVGELHEFGIALGCRLHCDLVEDTTGRGVDHGRGVGVDVGVDADDDIGHFT